MFRVDLEVACEDCGLEKGGLRFGSVFAQGLFGVGLGCVFGFCRAASVRI